MKKPLLFVSSFLFVLSTQSQPSPDSYRQALRKFIEGLDTLQTAADWVARAQAFERVAQAEPKQWLPLYYTAFCYIQAFNFEENKALQEYYTEQAERFLERADAQHPDQSEIVLLQSMAASMRVRLHPILNGPRYSQRAEQMLKRAQQLDPDNPRVYLQQAFNLYFTPRFWGGDKREARKMLDIAERKFRSFQPASDLHPNWGRSMLRYLRSLMHSDD